MKFKTSSHLQRHEACDRPVGTSQQGGQAEILDDTKIHQLYLGPKKY